MRLKFICLLYYDISVMILSHNQFRKPAKQKFVKKGQFHIASL